MGELDSLKSPGCFSILEIGLLAVGVHPDVTVAVVDPDVASEGLAARAIVHDRKKIAEWRKRLGHLSVVYPKGAVAQLEALFWGKLFEEKVAEWIRTSYSGRSYPNARARPRFKYLDGIGDVDVFGHDEESNPHRVLVCECKLRMQQATYKLVDVEEMSQLIRVWRVVQDHEQEKGCQESYSVTVYPLFVSNADGITREGWQLAREEKVEVLHARLPEDWDQQPHWRIVECVKMPCVDL
jgi:hypothetical protein